MSKEELLLKQLTDAISAGVDKMAPVAQEYVHQYVIGQITTAVFSGIALFTTAWLTIFFFKLAQKNASQIAELESYSSRKSSLESRNIGYNIAVGVGAFGVLISFSILVGGVVNALAPLPAIIANLN